MYDCVEYIFEDELDLVELKKIQHKIPLKSSGVGCDLTLWRLTY